MCFVCVAFTELGPPTVDCPCNVVSELMRASHYKYQRTGRPGERLRSARRSLWTFAGWNMVLNSMQTDYDGHGVGLGVCLPPCHPPLVVLRTHSHALLRRTAVPWYGHDFGHT